MELSLVLRPTVGMHLLVAVPHVVALGVCDALEGTGIAWPHDVVDTASGVLVTHVLAHGGYDNEGMFVRVLLDVPEDADETRVRDAVQARVDAWAAGAGAMPLAAVLHDYADALVQLGHAVDVVYPNGKVRARGTFAGVDAWGRASVRLASGEMLEFAPEKYRMVE